VADGYLDGGLGSVFFWALVISRGKGFEPKSTLLGIFGFLPFPPPSFTCLAQGPTERVPNLEEAAKRNAQ